MRKTIITFFTAFIFSEMSAAMEYIPESGISIQGLFGLNISNVRNLNTDAKAGFCLGVRMEYMMPNCYGIYLSTGLNYTLKGYMYSSVIIPDENYEQLLPSTKVTYRGNSYYLEIPIHLGYRYNFSDIFGIYGDFGPYFALGTNGKLRTNYDDDLWDDTRTAYFRNSKHMNIQRCDCGIGYRIGVEYDNCHSFTLSMDWGLTDIYRDSYRKQMAVDDFRLPKIHNFNCSLTYGYRF